MRRKGRFEMCFFGSVSDTRRILEVMGLVILSMEFYSICETVDEKNPLRYVYSSVSKQEIDHWVRTLLITAPTIRRHIRTPACTGAKIAERTMMKVPTMTKVAGKIALGLYGLCSSGSLRRRMSRPATVLT